MRVHTIAAAECWAGDVAVGSMANLAVAPGKKNSGWRLERSTIGFNLWYPTAAECDAGGRCGGRLDGQSGCCARRRSRFGHAGRRLERFRLRVHHTSAGEQDRAAGRCWLRCGLIWHACAYGDQSVETAGQVPTADGRMTRPHYCRELFAFNAAHLLCRVLLAGGSFKRP